MSEILEEVKRKLVFPIDFPSQQRTERVQNIVLATGSVLSCLVGFYMQSLTHLMVIYGLAVVLALIAVLPAYPSYTSRKLEWAKSSIVA
ncbi:hypothetical protein HG536_0E04890 [Torulaspora globosa]|uniref:Signal peptidase complex subunit 1 n=1 Tax=Torulaspora globosa TaxID=48254 RepID=A0A7G3ZJ92_9SACH|nr:uncharacterized protein HG536_0E04890 [Torulaspora globosa]QLL33578.1 hypothetical protein HG536_0E04890 [Torulaspora globosa]